MPYRGCKQARQGPFRECLLPGRECQQGTKARKRIRTMINSGPCRLKYCAGLNHKGDDDRVGHCHSCLHADATLTYFPLPTAISAVKMMNRGCCMAMPIYISVQLLWDGAKRLTGKPVKHYQPFPYHASCHLQVKRKEGNSFGLGALLCVYSGILQGDILGPS